MLVRSWFSRPERSSDQFYNAINTLKPRWYKYVGKVEMADIL